MRGVYAIFLDSSASFLVSSLPDGWCGCWCDFGGYISCQDLSNAGSGGGFDGSFLVYF
jgi:hypothetical protein